MALDPELIPFLEGPRSADLDDIPGSRARDAASLVEAASRRAPVPEGISISEILVHDASGRGVPGRIYRHRENATPSGVVLFLHGGAFVFGGLELEHSRCLYYAEHTGCAVVAVDYRLSPEYPYPAALDDAAVVLAWLVARGEELDVDPQRICVAGASAGGSLAAGLVLRTRDLDLTMPSSQMLLYPVLDDRALTTSMSQFIEGEPWDAKRTRQMWPLYLGHHDAAPAYAAPARATDLRGLPTTFLMSCELDPLRDEDLSFAQRLLEAGVSVELHHYRATCHGFDIIALGSRLSERALREQSVFLRQTIGEPLASTPQETLTPAIPR